MNKTKFNKGQAMKKLFFSSILGASVLLTNANANNSKDTDLASIQFLQGDTANSCGALLCLAGGKMDGECSSYIKRYFSIKMKKPHETIQARKNFLELCPKNGQSYQNNQAINDLYANTSQEKDPEFERYINEILPNLDGACTKEELNFTQKKLLRTEEICESDENANTKNCKTINHYGYRTNPELSNSCKLLLSNKYSNEKLTYTCKSKEYYEEEDWFNGYTKEPISKATFDSLSDEKRAVIQKEEPISYLAYQRLPNNEKASKYVKSTIQYFKVITLYYQKIPIQKDCWEVDDRIIYTNPYVK